MEGGRHGLVAEHLHAATMVGRVAAARAAVELGYGIEADPGPSERLRHWRIAGVPDAVIDVHSRRAAEIDAECERRGDHSSRARAVAARTTRATKEHGVEGELVARWRAELATIGWPVDRLTAAVDRAALELGPPLKLTQDRPADAKTYEFMTRRSVGQPPVARQAAGGRAER